MTWAFSFLITALEEDRDILSTLSVNTPGFELKRSVSYLPFRRLVLRKSSKMKTNVDATFSFMLASFSFYRRSEVP